MGQYSFDSKEVKKIIDSYANGNMKVKDQFMFYHLNRNIFNVKDEITTLKYFALNHFKDNFNRTWLEVPTFMNKYHMPKEDYHLMSVGFKKPYSRKFLLNDNFSGIDGQFEMIIRYDGKRIDALTHEGYQETYNFGRTIRHPFLHNTLDIKPHFENPNYTFKQDMGSVKIIGGELI